MKIKNFLLKTTSIVITMVLLASCAVGTVGKGSLPPLRSEERFANSQGVYDTEKYYYFTYGHALTRYNKQTKSKEIIVDYGLGSVAYVSDDCIYYTLEDGKYTLYKISDDDTEPTMMYELSADKIYFLNNKYIYSVSSNGSVTRSLNSAEKYHSSSEVIYTGNSIDITFATMYKDYIYYTGYRGGQLVRVSLKDGTSDIVAENIPKVIDSRMSGVLKWFVSDDKIVYVDDSYNLFSSDLDGSNVIDYNYSSGPVFVVKGYIYDGDKKIPLGNNDEKTYETLPEENEFIGQGVWPKIDHLSDVGDGVISAFSGIYLCDYDGKKIGW